MIKFNELLKTQGLNLHLGTTIPSIAFNGFIYSLKDSDSKLYGLNS
jgi:hypothetical protein